MIQTSGKILYSEVKGLLHLDEWWRCETRLLGSAFTLDSYGGEAASHMDNLGCLHAAPGYLWDGTSRPIVKGQGPVDVAPSLVHDLLYEAIRAGKLDPGLAGHVDDLYCRMLKEHGMGPVRVALRRTGLFLFGWTARRRSKGPQYPHRAAA